MNKLYITLFISLYYKCICVQTCIFIQICTQITVIYFSYISHLFAAYRCQIIEWLPDRVVAGNYRPYRLNWRTVIEGAFDLTFCRTRCQDWRDRQSTTQQHS